MLLGEAGEMLLLLSPVDSMVVLRVKRVQYCIAVLQISFSGGHAFSVFERLLSTRGSQSISSFDSHDPLERSYEYFLILFKTPITTILKTNCFEPDTVYCMHELLLACIHFDHGLDFCPQSVLEFLLVATDFQAS